MKIQILAKKSKVQGFTIIEVTIFLAVSAILLTSAMIMIGGKQNQVSFDEKMRDTLTKINQVISDVQNGFSGGDPAQESCQRDQNNQPVVLSGAPSATPECTFLGKAIQFPEYKDGTTTIDQASNLYIYSIFGINQLSDGTLPSDLVDSNPAAAVGQTIGNNKGVDLTETFSLNPAYIKNVTSKTVTVGTDTGPTNSHLVGFLLSLNTDSNTTSNGSEDVNAYAYRFDGSNPVPGDQTGSDVGSCISFSSGSPCSLPTGLVASQWPERLQTLQVCLTDGQRTAQITITSAGGFGASTELNYVAC